MDIDPVFLENLFYFYVKLIQVKKYTIDVFGCRKRILQNVRPDLAKSS